ncbi:MAG: M1 family aminopeptidase [Chitinophagales bacterium]
MRKTFQLKKYIELISREEKAAGLKMDVFHSAPTANYDLKYQRCAWTVSPDILFVSGNITSYFTLLETSDNIYFDASDSLVIDSVYFQNNPTEFEHVNNELKINFPSMPAGVFDSVSVYYHGVPSTTGFGSFNITPHDSVNTLWTLSEPYGASDWWPCKQTLDDKMDSIDVYVSTPSEYSSGGPGLLVNTIVDDGFTTYHWESNYPIVTYLVGIAVSNYEVYEFYAPHNGDSVLFYNLIYPESFDLAVGGINAIVPSFELFSDIYGDYSFAEEKYGHMQFGWGGGMEHQTMSSVTNFNYELLVHEMSHQWFGDKITCASWRDIWLNEGFATYSTWLSFDFSEDPNHYFEAWLSGTRNTITSVAGGSVWVDDTTLTSRIFDGRLTYYKGAWLLNMLRWELGDEDFFSGIKNYITDPELEYDFATTDDLVAHLESAADTTLTEFFDDWFYGQGFPAYHLLWTQDENNIVTIAVDQTTSHPSVDFFEMKIPIRFFGDNDTVDVILKNESNGQLFQFDPGFKLTDLRLDPDFKLLHANDQVVFVNYEASPIQVVIYPNPAEQILNVQVLSLNSSAYNLFVFNSAGQQMVNALLSLNANSGLIQVDVSTYAPGEYYLLLKNDKNEIVKRFMVK